MDFHIGQTWPKPSLPAYKIRPRGSGENEAPPLFIRSRAAWLTLNSGSSSTSFVALHF